MRPAVLFTCLFLALVTVGHLLRLVLQIPLIVGNWSLPMWPSVIAALMAGGLAVWLWRTEPRPAA